MVGSALVRKFKAEGNCVELILRSREELDLLRQKEVESFIKENTPDVVIIAAAKVGGIHANNTFRGEFIHDNLSIALNIIEAARKAGVPRLLNLGSTCIYPKEAPQPMPESCLLTGPLEQTNEPYAIAKIAALKLCQAYRQQYGLLYHSAMPTNLYGPGDNYHPTHSHVLPGLIRRFHEAKEAGAKEVTLWGSGKPRREFLHVDDLANAIHHLVSLENPPDWVNVGTGEDVSIYEAAELVLKTIGLDATIKLDSSKPDGTYRKLTDITLIRQTGWSPKIPLEEGLASTYRDFLNCHAS